MVVDLKTRLVEAARLWAEDQRDEGGADVPLSRLGKRVMDEGKFFDRLETGQKGPTTDTLERFARFLIVADNWRAGAVPRKVVEFAHCVGVSAASTVPSSDTPAADIGGGPHPGAGVSPVPRSGDTAAEAAA